MTAYDEADAPAPTGRVPADAAAGEGSVPVVRGLRWEHTVPRSLVHRRSVCEVLLTDAMALGTDRYRFAVQWPKRPVVDRVLRDDPVDPLLVAETVRQCGLMLATAFWRTPESATVVIKDLSVQVTADRTRPSGYGAVDLTCHTRVERARMGEGGSWPVMSRLSFDLVAAGVRMAQARGEMRLLTGPQYAAARKARRWDHPRACPAVSPVDPAAVGIQDATAVMVGRDVQGAVCVGPADLGHPFFFDHPSDHVPGIALIEAARQAAHLGGALAGRRLVAVGLQADRFVDWGRAARIHGEARAERWHFGIDQDGRTAVHGFLEHAAALNHAGPSQTA
jgi:2-oxo-3-(phosphooxy)propyl 3-oxoalkanoate synthase